MTRRGWALLGSMCVIWGLPYLLIRVAVRELDPAMLVCARTGIAALLLLPLAAARGELRSLLPLWRPILAFTVIEVAARWLLLASAEQRLASVGFALVLAGSTLATRRGPSSETARGAVAAAER